MTRIADQSVLTAAVGPGSSAVASSVALMKNAQVSGLRSFGIGLSEGDGLATVITEEGCFGVGLDLLLAQTYCVGIGAHLKLYAAACVAIGESLEAGVIGGADGQNATAIGFSGYARGRYSGTHGTNCYTQPGAQGSFVCGWKGASDRPGEFVHGSGSDNFVDTKVLTLQALGVTTPTKVLDVMGGTFTLAINSVHSVRVTVIGVTASRTKVAREVHELFLTVASAVTIESDETVAGAGALAAKGWACAITGEAGGELRLTCNPGTDTVNFFVRLDIAEVTGI